LRINIWISANGLTKTAYHNVDFPYKAWSVSNKKKRIYQDIDDVYDEIIKLYDLSKESGFEIGESLYFECAFFTDYELLVDINIQNRIKEYNYCKTFSCPPYPSMQETPAEIIEDFMIIEHEMNKFIAKENKDVAK